MQVTRPGEIPSPVQKWWYGKEAECAFCGQRVKLEAGDEVNEQAVRRPGGRVWVSFPCALCRNEVTMANVWMDRSFCLPISHE